MARWQKPAEGSWTEHYPDLGTGPVRIDVTPESYALEREAIFGRAWLNVGRVEELPNAGSSFTKELAAAGTSVVVVRDQDLCVRASRDDIGRDHCVAVPCDVWSGFVFVNLTDPPRWSLRDYLGPMVTALDGYPFERMTERYDFRADVESNWKIFLDAFQEYYHVPALHPQQVPPAVRDPNAAFECAHFELDGPHRVTSSGGARRWTMPREFMYPIEVATRSGLLGPWEIPDLGVPPRGLNPGRVDPWGIDNFQVFPNLEILLYHGWYLMYRYWPTSHGTHSFEGTLCFLPATTVRERVQHEVAAVVFKEFALQDAGTLKGTQMALDSGVLQEFPLCDQELLVRHFHATVAAWLDAYQCEREEDPR